jgi:hypothetical protein
VRAGVVKVTFVLSPRARVASAGGIPVVHTR